MGADLTDFGVRNGPRVCKRAPVDLGERRVGYLCAREADGATVYVTRRDPDKHVYHGEDPWYDLPFDGDGYGLSIDLFSRLHRAGVGAVYVVEDGTGDVYQFAYQQFVDGAPINFEDEARGRGYEKDRQMVVAVDDAVEVWEGRASKLYAVQSAFR